MCNQQVTLSISYIQNKLGSSETIQEESFFINQESELIERLRYSPTNIKNIYLFLNSLKSIFMNKLINVRYFHLLNFSIHQFHFSKNKNTINPPFLYQDTYNYQYKEIEINPY
jgi:hypothetical protein